MIFFEEDDGDGDGGEAEPRPSFGRYVVANVGTFALLLSSSVAAVVLAVLGIGYLGSHVPDASLWAWLAALFDRS
jgi:hypothetical protein